MDRLTSTARGVAAQIGRILDEAPLSELSERELERTTGIAKTTLRRRVEGWQPFDLDELHAIAEAAGMEVRITFEARHRAAS